MTRLASTFSTLIRDHPAPEPAPVTGTQLYYFCPLCNAERLFGLVAETATQEIYNCLECGCQKSFTVR